MPISASIPEQTAADSADTTNRDARNSDELFTLNKRVLTAVTPHQAIVVAAIQALRKASGIWPSGVAVARKLGRNMTVVRRHLLKLERLGVLLWAGEDVRVVIEPAGVFLGAPLFLSPNTELTRLDGIDAQGRQIP